jgi:hypothetical protein
MSAALIMLLYSAMLCVAGSASLIAQMPAPTAPSANVADTGDFAHGPSDFSRYTTPGLCVAAARYTSVVLRRTQAAQAIMDTIRDQFPTRDTLPASAIAVAQRCSARFSVSGTPAPELSDLLTLSLLAGNDSMARQVVERRLALTRNTAQRDTLFEAAIAAYLGAAPARMSLAQALVAQVDKLGPSEQITRLAMHDSLLVFAVATYDTAQIRQEANRLIALGHEVPASALQYDYHPIAEAYSGLLAIAFVAHPESLTTIAAAAKADLQRFPSGRTFPPNKPYWRAELLDYTNASLDQVLAALSPLADPRVFGQTPPPLHATSWFPTSPASWPPGSGPVSLIVYGGYGVCFGNLTGQYDFNGCGGFGELHAAEFEKIARYAASGIPVTLAVETWRSGFGGLPQSAAANVDTLRWYYRDHLKLPVNVAVVVDSVQQIPAPDGRQYPCNASDRFACPDTSASAKRYLTSEFPVVLLGRDGRLFYAGRFSPLLDALLARFRMNK